MFLGAVYGLKEETGQKWRWLLLRLLNSLYLAQGNLLWPSLGDNHPLFTLLIILGVAKIFHPSLTSDLTAAHLNCLLVGSTN